MDVIDIQPTAYEIRHRDMPMAHGDCVEEFFTVERNEREEDGHPYRWLVRSHHGCMLGQWQHLDYFPTAEKAIAFACTYLPARVTFHEEKRTQHERDLKIAQRVSAARDRALKQAAQI